MFEQVYSLIEKHDSIIIFGHLNPDGDCYGAAVALKSGLSLKFPNKKIYITGSGLPKFFDLLMPMDKVPDEVFPESLAVLVDANDLPRMEDNRVFNCKAWVKIDHHVDTGTFTEGPSVVVEDANSTCDILCQMFEECDIPMNEITANALYLGILTDSGHFQYVIDYPQTFERVSYICKKGANPKKINNILTLVSEKSLEAKSYIYSNYKKSKGGKVLYLVFDKKILKKLGLGANHASTLINLIGNIRGYPVWASFAEYDDGRVRLELRSNGPAVQPSAARVGGGGHMMASGATLPRLSDEIINDIIDDLDRVVEKYEKEGK